MKKAFIVGLIVFVLSTPMDYMLNSFLSLKTFIFTWISSISANRLTACLIAVVEQDMKLNVFRDALLA